MSSFFVQKFPIQLLCIFNLSLLFFGKMKSAQKLLRNVGETDNRADILGLEID